MKQIISFILTLSLFGCSNSNNKISRQTKDELKKDTQKVEQKIEKKESTIIDEKKNIIDTPKTPSLDLLIITKDDSLKLFDDTVSNYRLNVDSIKSQPISFYLSHPELDTNALGIYNGLPPMDDRRTFETLELAMTDNDELRPFYFHLMIGISEKSDGALGEIFGAYPLGYLKKYPDEFFNYFKNETYNGKIFYRLASEISFQFYFDDNPFKSVDRLRNTILKSNPMVDKDLFNDFIREINLQLKLSIESFEYR
ncbi:MAG: hypothetical protein JXQ87_19605 [Bacteroidia bacterium]